jgi:multiple sugar transport system substrate-binding protein
MAKCKALVPTGVFRLAKWKSGISFRCHRIHGLVRNRRWRATTSTWTAAVLLGCHAGIALAGSASSKDIPPRTPPQAISVWTHEDAGSREFNVIEETAQRFNRSQHAYRVEVTSSLRKDYEKWVHREAATGTLPCVLEFDGPLLAEYAWPGYLQPIDRFVPPDMLDDFLPSIVAQGTYQGQLYGLGQYDSGVALWGNRRHLLAAGVRIPTLESPWSLAEFEDALAKLAALKGIDYAINFSLYVRYDEFYSYAFSPILQSFGGDLIDRRNYRSAKGVLDGPQSVAAMTHFQHWIKKGWTRVAAKRQNDFDQGRVALSWTGHWGYPDYHKALGKDLVLMPLPDFGHGVKTGMGSWAWGISSTCHTPEGAWAFLSELLSTREILHMTNINGALPARRSALARSPLYGARGPLKFFVQQLEKGGVPRPTTPVYGTISRIFSDAVSNIAAGADVRTELGYAADVIDRTISEHRGYPYP